MRHGAAVWVTACRFIPFRVPKFVRAYSLQEAHMNLETLSIEQLADLSRSPENFRKSETEIWAMVEA
jgi:hypothetical protein